jgi:hypothetical protein
MDSEPVAVLDVDTVTEPEADTVVVTEAVEDVVRVLVKEGDFVADPVAEVPVEVVRDAEGDGVPTALGHSSRGGVRMTGGWSCVGNVIPVLVSWKECARMVSTSATVSFSA